MIYIYRYILFPQKNLHNTGPWPLVFPSSVASFVLPRLALPQRCVARGHGAAATARGTQAAAARLAPAAEKWGAQHAGDSGI